MARNTAVRRVNTAIRRLDWDEIKTAQLRDDDAAPVEVCEASLDDWERYVRSESQALKSRFMEWRGSRIWIVELPTSIHGEAVGRFHIMMLVGTGNVMGKDLMGSLAAYAHERPAGLAGEQLWEPDCSFGPNDTVVGAVLPNGLLWRDFYTVKVEIGVCQGWSGLNAKAAIWRQYPGVQYIVLIRLSPSLRVCQYRLEQRENGQFRDNEERMDIVNGSVLNFDAHLLLGLPGDANLPHGFQDPVTVDLFDIVEYARPRTGPAPQNAIAPPAV
ncbi:hypothetical protein PF005_g12658 [Phytophthora fragariae]|uniref:Uncharacterized protein n=1 Tax=Phytophthora fragariae TaxID=53985 RepID=A0A6A4DFJ5_9STRA|nr:hypothetical protein PF003_g26337 [Phytophthora fragariae]KAE8936186.1 hypothetical protein PF009_g13881 [Phytophthora fragariae]KAE9016008.1 hypothetical protein PF011_g7358 [Phytophthora fragariae]KAE9108831.1 hypothetical protein PF010_g11758 [Phytophthora fragariae]KAE9109127.1 hypothetical protein PF007_g12376 [Phytophthora fragariae]